MKFRKRGVRVDCSCCSGTGSVCCDDCNGTGDMFVGIEAISVYPNHKHVTELLELKKDAKRVTRQVDELVKMKPERAGSYYDQLRTVLVEIDTQARRLLDSP